MKKTANAGGIRGERAFFLATGLGRTVSGGLALRVRDQSSICKRGHPAGACVLNVGLAGKGASSLQILQTASYKGPGLSWSKPARMSLSTSGFSDCARISNSSLESWANRRGSKPWNPRKKAAAIFEQSEEPNRLLQSIHHGRCELRCFPGQCLDPDVDFYRRLRVGRHLRLGAMRLSAAP